MSDLSIVTPSKATGRTVVSDDIIRSGGIELVIGPIRDVARSRPRAVSTSSNVRHFRIPMARRKTLEATRCSVETESTVSEYSICRPRARDEGVVLLRWAARSIRADVVTLLSQTPLFEPLRIPARERALVHVAGDSLVALQIEFSFRCHHQGSSLVVYRR